MRTEGDALRQRLVAALRDRYDVEDLLDAGGAAFVFRARDRKHGRFVAVKVLRPELAATVGAQRFLQEIRIAANLTHPNILPLHDSGEADGLLYYVMPFVEGESLRTLLDDSGRIPDDDALRITQEVAQGLAHAHRTGIIHRDVKPENVLMSGGVAVVADFGIAKVMEVAGSAGLTHAGSAPSTPRYAAPEQLWDEGPVDHRADQYGLACIAFEMLTGRAPYEGTLAAVATRKVAESPPTVVEHRPDLPAEASAVLQRALARTPEERFDTVDGFADALRNAMGVSAMAPIGRPRSRAARWLGVAAAAALVVAGYLEFRPGGIGVPPAEESAVLAVLPFGHVGSEDTQYFTDGMTDEVAARIGGLPSVAVVSLASSRFFDPRSQSPEEIGGELGATHLLMGSVRIDDSGAEGRIRFTPRLVRVSDARELWSDVVDADLRPGQLFDVQTAVAEEVARALDLVLAPATTADFERPTESLEAYSYYLRASPLDAQFLVAEDTRRSIDMYRRAVDLDPGFAQAWAALGRAQSLYYYFFDRTPERFAQAQHAVEEAVALAPDDPKTRIAQGYLAYWGRLDYDTALDFFNGVGASTSSDIELLWVFASVQRRQGRYEEALRSFQRGMRLDPRSALPTFETGGTMVMLRRWDEALPLARRVRAIAPDWVPAVVSEAVILTYQGRGADAGAYLDGLAPEEGDHARLLPPMVEEVIYRPFWEMALSEAYQRALERSTSADFSDPGAYFLARAGRADRVGDGGTRAAFADSAVRVLDERLLSRPDDNWARIDLAAALALEGRPEEGRAHLQGLDAEALIREDAFRGPFWALELARARVATGDPEAAIADLEYLSTVPSSASGAFLRADRALAPLRADPRFQAVAARLDRPFS